MKDTVHEAKQKVLSFLGSLAPATVLPTVKLYLPAPSSSTSLAHPHIRIRHPVGELDKVHILVFRRRI
jgi:hypothetical protein